MNPHCRASLNGSDTRLVYIYITLVLLLGYCIGTITSLPWAESCSNNPRPPECPDDCDHNKYYVGGDGMCKMCLKCAPGEELDKPCGNGRNGDAVCKPCEKGHFSSEWDYECIPCRICTNTEELNTCRPTGDRECGDCLFGFFRGSSIFFDPNACPDSCEHNDPSEPLCREWWQWKAQQQSATESPPVVPQDVPEEGPDIPETVLSDAVPRQNPIDAESPVVDKLQISENANAPEQQAAVKDDSESTAGGIPYVTIIIALATTLVIVIVVFSVALCLIYLRRTQPPKLTSRIGRGRPLPDSPLLPRSGNSTPHSAGSPEIGQKLSNPYSIPAGVWPYLLRPTSFASSSSSGVECRQNETSSAESTPKVLPKATPYHHNGKGSSFAQTRPAYQADAPRVVTEGPAGIAVPCNGNQSQTVARRRSVSLPPEEFAQLGLRRRSSLADLGNGRHVGNGRKEPEAALFSEEPEIIADRKDETAIPEVRPDRPKTVANDPHVSTGNGVSTSPGQVISTRGIDDTDHATVVDREVTQGRATRNHERRAPNPASMNISKPTDSAAHIHITFSEVSCRKVQIGDEHHHNQENEPLQLGNVEDRGEDSETETDQENDQLLG